MRRLLRLNAMLIEASVSVVGVVGGLAAGSLRRLASIGEHPPEDEPPGEGADPQTQP